MKATSLLTLSFLFASCTGFASPALTVGTPADSLLASPSSAYPWLGGQIINFDNYAPGTTFSPGSPLQYLSGGVTSATISSPDSLVVLPYSTQSGPNYLFDNSGNGTADIAIQLTSGVRNIAVGIADSDPVTITLQALNTTGAAFGSAFSVTIDDSASNNNSGNGYFELSDATNDIWGLQILQISASSNYSGLAIDDVQYAPEPASIALLGFGAAFIAGFAVRKRA